MIETPGGIAFVQLVMPAEAAALTTRAIRTAILFLESVDPAEADPALLDQLDLLAETFEDAARNPRGYPVTGKMATRLKARARRGPVGPLTGSAGKPKRVTRHKARIEKAKARRAYLKAQAGVEPS